MCEEFKIGDGNPAFPSSIFAACQNDRNPNFPIVNFMTSHLSHLPARWASPPTAYPLLFTLIASQHLSCHLSTRLSPRLSAPLLPRLFTLTLPTCLSPHCSPRCLDHLTCILTVGRVSLSISLCVCVCVFERMCVCASMKMSLMIQTSTLRGKQIVVTNGP